MMGLTDRALEKLTAHERARLVLEAESRMDGDEVIRLIDTTSRERAGEFKRLYLGWRQAEASYRHLRNETLRRCLLRAAEGIESLAWCEGWELAGGNLRAWQYRERTKAWKAAMGGLEAANAMDAGVYAAWSEWCDRHGVSGLLCGDLPPPDGGIDPCEESRGITADLLASAAEAGR